MWVGTVVVQDRQFEDLRDRVVTLEQKYAVREETLMGVNTRLGRIESTLSRITWILVGGILSGLVAFIAQGGLRIPPNV